ncbi:YbhB/YbcL family Raf kinase inhibitor-like protein [Sulfurimonas sp. MAG313]|nr:YbhB/YbcL family Raf kinase inhibitor-like protein [Sulfurimonas sp. MAG313]MDF1879878.1 YbhB/YbcL family Raf kinase inhibitor-like protein [Sulfurimonas sp. MAG313]
MKKTILIFLVLIGLGSNLLAEGLSLSSKDLKGQLSINEVFNGFGCKGQNISPELSWKNAPKGTKSFALSVYDPDAPTGSGWWHWLVFNIDSKIDGFEKGIDLSATSAIESMTDFGTSGFGGACPPKGDKAHQYIFTIYALDIKHIDLKKEANPALVGFYINAHTLSKASLIAYYAR